MSYMSKTLEFIKAANVFYVATVEGNQPRVRPFGAISEYNGKLYICTNNQKEVFKQLEASPKLEICALSPDFKWLRLAATGIKETDIEAKKKMLQDNLSLNDMYKLDDGIFEVIRLDDMVAKVYSFTDPVVTLDD